MTDRLPKRLAESRKAMDKDALESALQALMVLVNDHDTYTGGHSYRVADIAANTARLMGRLPSEVALVQRAGFVHDIGKIGIPDRILSKSGPLSAEEFAMIKLHPMLGANILSRHEGMQDVADIVLHHHERWDGNGYPNGLAGVEIPIESRIVFVADAFDAMTTERPYGTVLTTEEALAELRTCAGKQFDPLVVDAIHEVHRLGLLDDDVDTSSYSMGLIP